MLKIVLSVAIIGHILCGLCDCLLSYSKSGRLDLKQVKDPVKMREMFCDMPLSYPLASVILGTFAITLFGFGYFGLSNWMILYSKPAGLLMYVSSVFFLIPIVVHHVICGVVEWIYIRLGLTDEAREVVFEFQNKTIITMIVGYLGLLVFLITLFVMIMTGRTAVPIWGCVFNTLVIMLLLIPTNLPAKGNIAGAIMFLGLLCLI